MSAHPMKGSNKASSLRRRCTLDDDNLRDDFECGTPSTGRSWQDEDSADEATPLSIRTTGLDNDEPSIVGVSIGRQQSHLASPDTPAAERAEALRGHLDDAFDEDFVAEDLEDSNLPQLRRVSATEEQGDVNDQPRISGWWRLDVVYQDKWKAISFDGSSASASSRPASETVAKKSMLSMFPRRFMPRLSSPPSIHVSLPTSRHSSNLADDDSLDPPTTHGPYWALELSRLPPSSISGHNYYDHGAILGGNAIPLNRRRATSEGQLSIQRTLSIAPSLGDDTRWEHVSEQINSRVRALKDSWIDSNFKLPTMKDFTSLNFGAPWAEFLHHDDHVTETRRASVQAIPEYDGTRSTHHSTIPLNSGLLMSEKAGDMPTARKMSKVSALQHPHFQKTLDTLTGDVVILGGYRGSILRSAKPPHRQLWVPMKVGLNLRKANLELGLDAEDELNSEEHIIPSGMLKNIGPVDISRRLFKRLRSSKHAREGRLRVWDYGYDWRLSPHLLSQQLLEALEELPCNAPNTPPQERGALVIAHSLGGLVTRHAVNIRPDLFSAVLYAGVPQHCVNILGPMRNGDPVLLSSRVLTAQVNFTIRTSFALLPLDGKCFLDQQTREPYPIDFFDPATWDEYRLSPVMARPLPPLYSAPSPTLFTTVVNSLPGMSSFTKPGSQRNSITLNRSGISTPTVSDNTQPSPIINAIHDLQSIGGAPQMSSDHSNNTATASNQPPSISTTVTLPHAAAQAYLTRTLASIKAFKQELAFLPSLAIAYPPHAILYGKSLPTVSGCRVRGRDGIKRSDAYDDLTFASGDGVVLARAAQIPVGYETVRKGVVSSERGHISLLGDLEGVGRCLNALVEARERGCVRRFERLDGVGGNGEEGDRGV